MKLSLALLSLCLPCAGQTVQILNIAPGVTNDAVYVLASPVQIGSNYVIERMTYNQYGQPQYTTLTQFTPQYMAYGITVTVPHGGFNGFRTRMLIPPTH